MVGLISHRQVDIPLETNVDDFSLWIPLPFRVAIIVVLGSEHEIKVLN